MNIVSNEENKFIIAGLGNPGKRYLNTRHNFGFLVLDRLAERLGTEFRRMQHKAMVTNTRYNEKLVILAKPRTFMNNSGQSIRSLANFYKVPHANILIIFDDADLDFEIVRLRKTGGSSGQKGMASIIQALGTQDIPRMRLGLAIGLDPLSGKPLGRPEGKLDTSDFVLLPFSRAEEEILPFILDRASEAALTFIEKGIDTAMNKFNSKAI